MTKLKIYTNHSDKLIVTINNIDQLIKEYEIDPQSYNFQDLFESEILGDIFEQECLNSSHVYYELI